MPTGPRREPTSLRLAAVALAAVSLPALAPHGAAASPAASSASTHGAPGGGSRDETLPDGLAYYLPRTVVSLSAVRRTVTARRPSADLSQPVQVTDADVTFDVRPDAVADTAQAYVLEARPDFWKSKALDVRLSSAGLLAAVNMESTGQAGPAVLNFLRGAVRTALLLGALDAAAPEWPPWPAPDGRCETLRLEALSLEKQLFVKRSEAGCGGWLELKEKAALREEWETRLQAARVRLEQADSAAFPRALTVVRETQEELRAREAAYEQSSAAFERGFGELQKSIGLFRKETVEPREVFFDLAELPGEEALAALWDGKGNPAAHAKMRALIRWGQIGISLDAVGKAPAGKAAEAEAGKDEVVLRYRPSRPHRLGVWVKEETDGRPVLKASRVVEVFVPGDLVRRVHMPLSSWSRRTLKVEFDAHGRLVQMSNSSEANVPAVSAAIADAGKVAAETYLQSLEQLGAVQKARSALEVGEITRELEALKAQKERVDLETALAGAESSAEAVVRKQQIDARIAAAEAELRLRKAESTGDLSLEVAVLQAEVERLKQQLARLLAERALEAETR